MSNPFIFFSISKGKGGNPSLGLLKRSNQVPFLALSQEALEGNNELAYYNNYFFCVPILMCRIDASGFHISVANRKRKTNCKYLHSKGCW